MNEKALIAMSGGVDSSVALYLMKNLGYDCIGVTMKFFGGDDDQTGCSPNDAEDARNTARSFGIPHYVLNCTDDFKGQVIDRFVNAYQNGATPNPCVDCNRHLKFEKLLTRAKELGAEHIATGHYARTERDGERALLKKAADTDKDQTYVLYALTQEQLRHTVFPLGGLRKSEVRKIASGLSLSNAQKRDSQDICFVPDGDYPVFIERYTGREYEGGDFIDTRGNVLGRHKGLIRYTVGQRKGLGLALHKPMYVREKDVAGNTVTLCENDELYSKSLDAGNINLIPVDKLDMPLRVKAKVRYRQPEQWATATQVSADRLHIEFDEPQRAITKGQAVVIYDGDMVVGGGTIL